MADYPEYISPKRKPVAVPESVVEDGVVHYGTFDAPFKSLNLLDAEAPCGGKKASARKKAARLTEWEAFEVNMDEGTLISAIYKTTFGMGFSIFVWYDKAEDKIYSWRNVVPKKKSRVAAQLVDDYCHCKTKHSEYRIDNDLSNGFASAKGYSEGKSGEFSIDMKFERVSAPSNAVMPLAKTKDGELCNPLYSEKDLFKVTGHIVLNGKVYESNERTVGIIDDHKGYYPYKAHYDWLTTMCKIDDEGEQKYFGFNLTRNQSVDQDAFNENYIWVGEELHPLPPVVFAHKDGKKKASEWHVTDEKGLGLVDVTFKISKTFYMPIHLGVIECYYALPFGKLSGYLTGIDGKKYYLDGMTGVGEDKTTRM